jgi:hypothetical protein
MNRSKSVRQVRFDGPFGSERQARLSPQYPSHGFQTLALQLWTTPQDFVACRVASRRLVSKAFCHLAIMPRPPLR